MFHYFIDDRCAPAVSTAPSIVAGDIPLGWGPSARQVPVPQFLARNNGRREQQDVDGRVQRAAQALKYLVVSMNCWAGQREDGAVRRERERECVCV